MGCLQAVDIDGQMGEDDEDLSIQLSLEVKDLKIYSPEGSSAS